MASLRYYMQICTANKNKNEIIIIIQCSFKPKYVKHYEFFG